MSYPYTLKSALDNKGAIADPIAPKPTKPISFIC